MIEEERQRILDNLSPDNREKFCMLENISKSPYINTELYWLKAELKQKEKDVAFYMTTTILMVIIFFIILIMRTCGIWLL